MAAFPGHYEAIMECGGISDLIPDFQDKKSQHDVISHLANQSIQFSPEDIGLISCDSCEDITTEAINPWPVSNTHPISSTHAAGNEGTVFYESTMDSLGWQEIINLIMTEEEQVVPTLYGSPAGDKAVYSETKSTLTGERTHCDAHSLCNGENHPTKIDKKPGIDKPIRFRVMNGQHCADYAMEVLPPGEEITTHRNMKKRKTDKYVSGSGRQTYVQDSAQKGPLKKSKKNRCKSAQRSNASKDPGENSNPKSEVLMGENRESLFNNVEEPKAESQKDYIYVRARRGQATDRHSLTERVRRKKIRDRMKILQDLVPGCNVVNENALVLDKIIDYVQSLQRQVQILSMKLASVPQ